MRSPALSLAHQDLSRANYEDNYESIKVDGHWSAYGWTFDLGENETSVEFGCTADGSTVCAARPSVTTVRQAEGEPWRI